MVFESWETERWHTAGLCNMYHDRQDSTRFVCLSQQMEVHEVQGALNKIYGVLYLCPIELGR